MQYMTLARGEGQREEKEEQTQSFKDQGEGKGLSGDFEPSYGKEGKGCPRRPSASTIMARAIGR